MSREKALLASAIKHLTTVQNTFEVKPWRSIVNSQVQTQFVKAGRRATDPIIPLEVVLNLPEQYMPSATAKEKAKAVKEAQHKLAANGVTKPKHIPGESAPGVKAIWPQSGVVTTPNPTGETMNTKSQGVAADEKALADQKAADKNKAIAEKAAAKVATEVKKAAEKELARVEREAKQATAKTEREAKQAAALEARKTAAGEGSKRSYFGSMTALAERVKSGVYVKSSTGQLRSNDDLALALDAVPTDNVIKLCMLALGLKTMPEKYVPLNRGQQSMNLRNRLRGAIKADEGKGAEIDGRRVTLALVKEIRDANNFATAEAEKAAKDAAKAVTAKQRKDLKEAKDLAAAVAAKAKVAAKKEPATA